jgi:hypothetical protein
MAWNKSGDERARSYQVYKDLEKLYLELQQRYELLEAKLAVKDETIMRLSRELYQALEGSMQHEASNRPGLAKAPAVGPAAGYQETPTPIPTHKPSAVVPRHGATMQDMLEPQPHPKRKEG